MKLPRKGILIRLAIYLPLIGGLLVWRACYFEREEIAAEPSPQQPSPRRIDTIVGPNGEEVPVYGITREEAKAMGVDASEFAGQAPADKADESKAE
jgi:hypothetical protein